MTSLFVLLEKIEGELLLNQADAMLLANGKEAVLKILNSKVPASGCSFCVDMQKFRSEVNRIIEEDKQQLLVDKQRRHFTMTTIVISVLCFAAAAIVIAGFRCLVASLAKH